MNLPNPSTLQLFNVLSAVHLENLLFLLFVAVAMLFQLLARAAGKASKNSAQPRRGSPSPAQSPPPVPHAEPQTDEERIRKFLEALGQPTTAKPPSPVAQRPTYRKPIVIQHVPPFASPLPPLTTRPPDLPRETQSPRQMAPAREKKVFVPRAAEAPVFEVHQGPLPTEPAPTIGTPTEAYAIATQPGSSPEQTKPDIASLLRSTSGLRNAIILREIFGPPRSMQPLDFL